MLPRVLAGSSVGSIGEFVCDIMDVILLYLLLFMPEMMAC